VQKEMNNSIVNPAVKPYLGKRYFELSFNVIVTELAQVRAKVC